MCKQCDDLQRRLDQFRRAISTNLDALTTERLQAGIVEMEEKKLTFHAEQK